MIRFYRSIITTAGITLGIAFLVSVWTTAEVDFKIKEGSGQRQEIILATSATVEGQTTAFYIQDSLKNTNVRISKLAQGLPVGGEIENLDDGTLISAFKNRQSF